MIPKLNHTQVPNLFIDQKMSRLSGNATKIFISICRKTIGWHKETDQIAHSQLSKLSGIKHNVTIQRAVEELIDDKLIIMTRSGSGRGIKTNYEINFDNISKNDILKNGSDNDIKKADIIPENDIKEGIIISENDTTKERNINKNNIKKDDFFLNLIPIELNISDFL